LNTKNIQKKIESLLNELKAKTGVTEEDLDELKTILDIADLSKDH
tara:strand:+ start:977 stop:1111 length:135 start_codon:yes stop_codon:yes gene_type:complete